MGVYGGEVKIKLNCEAPKCFRKDRVINAREPIVLYGSKVFHFCCFNGKIKEECERIWGEKGGKDG